MKTVFILNPKAGSTDATAAIESAVTKYGSDNVSCHRTTGIGDTEGFARRFCEEHPDEDELRVIACGGDGTVNDVLNGIYGYGNAVLGVLPIGTGNDFVRNFRDTGDFRDVTALINGRTEMIDVIRYTGVIDGREQTRYCANMFNIGFDCNVVDLTARMKTKPFISGSLAYLLSVLVILIKKKGADLRIELDGTVYQDGKLLLTSVANGSFCGGGVMSNPLARVNDGSIDVNIVHNVTRIQFLKLFPKYQKGTHINIKGIEKTVEPHKCTHAVITPRAGSMRLCVDGEIYDAGETTFDIIHDAVKVLIPAK